MISSNFSLWRFFTWPLRFDVLPSAARILALQELQIHVFSPYFLYSAVQGLLCCLLAILIQSKCSELNSNGENCLNLMRGYLHAWVIGPRTSSFVVKRKLNNIWSETSTSPRFFDIQKIYFREKGKIPAEKNTETERFFLWRYRGIGVWKKNAVSVSVYRPSLISLYTSRQLRSL